MSTETKNENTNKTPNPGTKDALKAENEALKAELEALKAAKAEAAAEPEQPKETGPKMVKIKIPKTKEQKEDVFVSVNFRTYQIQRGVEVEVPDFVAEVLRHQEEMLERIMLFEEEVQKKN